MNKHINTNDYNYHLPAEKIALFPCKNRDESKLLIYKNGSISESVFKQISDYLEDDCMLVFNDTKVIHARIVCFKPTGGRIELFCLEPLSPTPLHTLAFEVQETCQWKCFIRNNKRLTVPLTLQFDYKDEKGILHIEKLEAYNDASFRVQFSWSPKELSFAEILENVGKIPLPPYIQRDTVKEDGQWYQTVFANEKGSVAAPTAGLHFTTEILEKIKSKNIQTTNITLHVGAGTFKPVTEMYIENHVMHAEQLFFTKESIHNLLKNNDKKIIAVGTTTTRSLESLYWIGVKIHQAKRNQIEINPENLLLGQWEVYEELSNCPLTVSVAFEVVLDYMNQQHINSLHVSTSIIITPCYVPKVVKGIITNFHQPKSTLLLLISAFVGDKWKNIYDYALAHDFRFLSYGDACLFF